MSGENPFAPVPKDRIEAVPVAALAKDRVEAVPVAEIAHVNNNNPSLVRTVKKGRAKGMAKGMAKVPRITNRKGKGKGKGKQFIPRITKGEGERRILEENLLASSSSSGSSRKQNPRRYRSVFQPTLSKNDTGKKDNKSFDSIFDDSLKKFSFHFCGSPLFTNDLLQKFRKDPSARRESAFLKKFEKFLDGVELQNRFELRNELQLAPDATQRREIIENICSVCGDGSNLTQYANEFMVFLLSDSGDNSDILIFKKRGKVRGVALVSKSEDYPDTFKLELICSNKPMVGSFLMMMYLLALNAQPFRFGFLQVAGGYSNLNALCLYDKFGFREDPHLIKKHKELYMICDLMIKNKKGGFDKKQESGIYNTFLFSLPDRFLPDDWSVDESKIYYKHEPLCSEAFQKLPKDIQEGIIEYRQNCLDTIRTQADIDAIYEITKDSIKHGIIPE